MNNLNSILIEGTINNDAILIGNNCTFDLVSNRYYKEKETSERLAKEITIINIELLSRQTQLYFKKLTKGNSVRVVGRIKNNNEKIVIVAEHLELKLKF